MADFSIMAKLGLDSSKFNSKLKGAKGAVGKFGSAIGSVVKAGVATAGVALTGMALKGVADFVKLDKGMREVFTLLPDATQAMKDQMEGDIRELATNMGVDLDKAVQALYSSISAGVPEENVVAFLEDATKLAVGGVTDLDTAVAALTTVMNGYGDAADSTEAISDILFTTVKGGMTTIDELSANIGKVTPVAADLGVEFEEVGAMFSALTSVLGDGKTAEAGTQIKTMLNELGKAGTTASDAFKELSGKSFREFIGNGGSVKDALLLMKDGANAAGISLSDMFGSVEAGNAALALSRDDAKKLTAELEAQAGAAGATKAAFDEMEQSVSRKMDKLGAKVKEIGLKMGEQLIPVAEDILPMVGNAFDMLLPILGATSDAEDKTAGGMDVIKAAASALLKGILMVVNVFNMWGVILTYVGRQIATFASLLIDLGSAILGPIVEQIKGAGDAFSALGDILANPQEAAKGLEKLKKAHERMGKAFDGFGKKFGDAWDKNLAGFEDNNRAFGRGMAAVGNQFKNIWNAQLGAAGAAQGANQGAVNPLIAGAAAANQINQNLGQAAGQANPLKVRMQGVEAVLKGARGWLAKCVAAQKEWNAAAEAGKAFHTGTVGILEKLLQQERLTAHEKKQYLRMLKQQKALEEAMLDVTRKGFNWLILEKAKAEHIAELGKRNIKDLAAFDKYYQDILRRIKLAEANMKGGAFMANMMGVAGAQKADPWADKLNMGLEEAQDQVAHLERDLEDLKRQDAFEGKAEAAKKLGVEIGKAKDKAQALNGELEKAQPLLEGPPGGVKPQGADFKIFEAMDKKLGEINTKLGGFFINQ